jgi:hypothetical protein
VSTPGVTGAARLSPGVSRQRPAALKACATGCQGSGLRRGLAGLDTQVTWKRWALVSQRGEFPGTPARSAVILRPGGRHLTHPFAGGPAAAQSPTFGWHEATPNAMLTNIPMPQRQFQALGAYRTGHADGDRGVRLAAGDLRPGTDREPVIGIKETPGAHRALLITSAHSDRPPGGPQSSTSARIPAVVVIGPFPPIRAG